jgi:hypothetical protein
VRRWEELRKGGNRVKGEAEEERKARGERSEWEGGKKRIRRVGSEEGEKECGKGEKQGNDSKHERRNHEERRNALEKRSHGSEGKE